MLFHPRVRRAYINGGSTDTVDLLYVEKKAPSNFSYCSLLWSVPTRQASLTWFHASGSFLSFLWGLLFLALPRGARCDGGSRAVRRRPGHRPELFLLPGRTHRPVGDDVPALEHRSQRLGCLQPGARIAQRNADRRAPRDGCGRLAVLGRGDDRASTGPVGTTVCQSPQNLSPCP